MSELNYKIIWSYSDGFLIHLGLAGLHIKTMQNQKYGTSLFPLNQKKLPKSRLR